MKKNFLLILFAFLISQLTTGLIILISTPPKGEYIQLFAAPTAAPIMVYITGEVLQPNIYEFIEPSRVKDLVEASGGFTEYADPESINLAAILFDGQQIHIPSFNDPGSIITESNLSFSKIDINSASLEELTSLPNIGEAKANAIIQYREENGRFTNVAEIINVPGIGESIYQKIIDLITIY
ncbi:MAG: helix-hairpin-helix domain-containing protein [Bacteroidales bacterium]|nr:helix-hairpin-helix domain-containing protein [Bacteroidales bacterium]